MNKQPESESNHNTAASPREKISLQATVDSSLQGLRFDQIAAQLFPDFSRAKLQQWINDGSLTVDGAQAKPRSKLMTGSALALEAEFEPAISWQAEPMALDIIYQDEQLLVINKPHNLVVHPASGISSGTLANAVLAHCPANAELPRSGIVHRLDKDTTGLLMVAKTLKAHHSLVAQLQARTVSRQYRAVLCGELVSGGSIDAPIGRHPTHRTKMAVIKNAAATDRGKPAITHYLIAQRFKNYTEVSVKLETGRTHQIRVHMAHIRHPLLGDATYNPRYQRPAGIDDASSDKLKAFNRQALHACALSFNHPSTDELVEFTCDPPADYMQLIETLKTL